MREAVVSSTASWGSGGLWLGRVCPEAPGAVALEPASPASSLQWGPWGQAPRHHVLGSVWTRLRGPCGRPSRGSVLVSGTSAPGVRLGAGPGPAGARPAGRGGGRASLSDGRGSLGSLSLWRWFLVPADFGPGPTRGCPGLLGQGLGPHPWERRDLRVGCGHVGRGGGATGHAGWPPAVACAAVGAEPRGCGLWLQSGGRHRSPRPCQC